VEDTNGLLGLAKRKGNLEEIARAAGVSRSTVSLVLRGSALIAPKTAVKVREAATQLGYVYNRTAAALRNRKTHTIGLIEANFKNPFFAAMSDWVERELDRKGKTLLFADSSESIEKQSKVIQLMLEHGVDGILICPVKGTTKEDLQILETSRVPFVLFSRYIPGWDTDYVGAANYSGAYHAVQRLIQLGHRRIVFVGGESSTSAWFDRNRGFRNALAEEGLPIPEPASFLSEVSAAGGSACVEAVLAMNPVPTAALCYSDTVAFGFMMGLEKRGIVIQRDFSVVGFDDLPEAKLWRPPLATVACPPAKVGIEATHLLMERIEKGRSAPHRIEIEGTLIERESMGKILKNT